MSNDFVYQLKQRISVLESALDLQQRHEQATVRIRENRERAEAAESALAELRARITALREEWSEAAEWEFDNSNTQAGQRLSQCADELAVLLDPPVRS